MGTPNVPFDPTGSPFPKNPPTSGERDDKREDEEQKPDDGSEDLS